MSVVINALPNAFAGEVSGVRCAEPLAPEDIAAIREGMARHAVLVFRGQPLTDEQQLAVTRQFGDLERYETPGHIRKREQERLGAGVADFSNLTRDGSLIGPDDRVWLSSSAIGCGTPTARSVRSRPVIHCCPGAQSLLAAARRNSRTCARPMTRSMSKQKPRSRISSASIR